MIIKCPNELPKKKEKWYVFLAGPIQGAPEWQNTVPNSSEIVWLSPRRDNYDNFNYNEQTEWETTCMRIADVILFWIPGRVEYVEGRDYAQTTRTEFGEYIARGKKLIVGIYDEFPGRRYFETKAEQYGINKIHNNFKDCLIELADYIKECNKNTQTFYTSDTHFGSERAWLYSKRPFSSVNEMDWKLIENWNKVVHPKDTIWHCGDFGNYEVLQYLNGIINIVLGNYEREEMQTKNLQPMEYTKFLKEQGFADIQIGPFLLKDDNSEVSYTLVHEPLSGITSKDDSFILFGHIHGRQKIKKFGIDVGVDANNYTPMNTELVEFFRKAIINKHYDAEVWCNENSKPIRNTHKVFLGGTYNSKWRDEIIPMLKIQYFNPIVENWTSECQAEEERQKNNVCDLQLYVITSDMTGVFSIAEVSEAAINLNERCVFCILNIENFSEAQQKSLKAVENLVKKYNGKVCNSLQEIAEYLNNY